MMVCFAKGLNYNSNFMFSEIFALITEAQLIHSQREMKGRMNPSFLSTDPEVQLEECKPERCMIYKLHQFQLLKRQNLLDWASQNVSL